MNEKHIKEGILLTWFLVVAKIIILLNHLLHDGSLSRSLTGANVDLAITCVFLHFMYKRYTIASLCMLVYFICNQLIKMTDQPAYIIMLVMGMFIYARAIAACYKFNSGSNISLLLRITNFICFFLFVSLNLTSVTLCYEGASSQDIVKGTSINRIKREKLLSHRLINDAKDVVYFYSPMPFIEQGGIVLKQTSMMIYVRQENNSYYVQEVMYKDVMRVDFKETLKDKAVYEVHLNNGDIVSIVLPAERGKSEIILDYIRNYKEY